MRKIFIAAACSVGLAFQASAAEPLDKSQPRLVVAQALDVKSLLSSIAANWNPLDTKQQRWRGIAGAEQGLASLGAPSVAVFVDKDSISKHVEKEISKVSLGVNGLKLQAPVLTFRQQGIDVHLAFEVPISAVSVSGTADGTVSLAVIGTSLSILPAFSTFRVTNVDAGNQIINAGLAGVVNAGLSSLLKALNAAAQTAVKPIPIEISPIAPVDIAGQLKAIPGVVRADAKPIAIDYTFAGAVPLIDETGLTILARMAPKTEPGPGALPEAPQNVDDQVLDQKFAAFGTKFHAALDAAFPGLPASSRPWAATSRLFVASVLARETNNAAVSVAYQVNDVSTTFKSGPIQPFNYESISCPLQQDARECALRQCTLSTDTRECAQPHDERECGRCADVPCPTWSSPGRFCRKCINDPVCEGAKATQNGIYATNKAACESAKAGQNTLYQTQFVACQADAGRLKAQCEAEKTGQNAIYASLKAACETGKEAVKRLQLIGPIGEVHGDAHATGTLNVKLSDIAVDSGLERVSAKLAVGGAADINGNVGFQPYNAGVVVCVFPWQEPFRTKATIPSQDLVEAVTVDIHNEADRVAIEFELQSQDAKFSLRPTPVEALFVAHPQVALNCSLVAAVAGVGAAVQPITGDMLGGATSGDFKQKIPSLKFATKVPAFDLPVADEKLHLSPQLLNGSILFSAK